MNAEDIQFQLGILRPKAGDVLVVSVEQEFLTDDFRNKLACTVKAVAQATSMKKTLVLVLATGSSATLLSKATARKLIEDMTEKG